MQMQLFFFISTEVTSCGKAATDWATGAHKPFNEGPPRSRCKIIKLYPGLREPETDLDLIFFKGKLGQTVTNKCLFTRPWTT